MGEERWTGGCQCGAVRYEVLGRPMKPYVCHCRMCQKQFGSFFGVFVDVDKSVFKTTRGQVAYFQSSSEIRRGYCRDCGTPLTAFYAFLPRIAVTIGSFDRHSDLRPVLQFGVESREPWLADCLNAPGMKLGEGDNGPEYPPERLEEIRRSNRQHPDHDTETWPPPA
jgi:hypothetical protein